jgi:adenine-specific DNA-methyltransferase
MSSTEYTSAQIITYMGNKRKMLPFIEEVLVSIKTDLGVQKLKIGDGFSGSGVVSRLFKQHANHLYTNDLAGYSYTLNTCYLANPTPKFETQIQTHIDEANRLASVDAASDQTPLTNAWISKHWAPKKSTITANDRAYFTYENGRRIDIIRDYIDTLPGKVRPFLLAPLLVESSIHNNTSGQFSAFYKDGGDKGAYGGKNGIDVKRITKPITLPYPIFSPAKCKVHTSKMDTNKWAESLISHPKLDVVYYDPPYNKHPYNIYYFMLDIINDWDKTIEIPRTNRGQPETRTKSAYNSSLHAKQALDDLLANTNSRYVVLSYNNGGIIPIPELDLLLAKHATNVNKIPIDHKTYNRLKGLSNYKRTSEPKAVKEYLYVLKMND